jgi:uncharacterized membrane protein
MSHVKVSVKIIRALVLAAIYASLVWLLPGISYGPIQIRVSIALTPLAYVMGIEGVIGITLGNTLANALSPYGIWDVIIGFLVALTYTTIDYALGKMFGYRKWMLPIVAIINALVIGAYIGYLLLGVIARVGDPVTLFWLLTAQNFIPAIIGAVVLVPIVKRYVR